MDAPAGLDSARVADSVARHPTHPRTVLLAAAATALVFAVVGGVPALAQEPPEPVPTTMARLASQSLLLDAAVAGDALVVVGERGHVLVSDDAGATWRQSKVPTRSMLTAVDFLDSSLGWAVGHDSVILRTEDGGVTWTIVHWAPENEEPLFDVRFDDTSNGVAIGAYGSFYRTTDGGQTWEFETVGEMDWHLHRIAHADDGTRYIAAEAGVIYRSDDGGASWIELPSPYEGSFFGVLPLEERAVLVYGLRGNLFRSEDAGETWRQIDTDTVAMLTDGGVLEDGTVVIVGLGGTVLVSDDGGNTFHRHQQPGRRGISRFVETPSGSLLLVGEFGIRVASLDELTAPRTSEGE